MTPNTPVGNTLALLTHFRAFLASPCTRMKDPMDSWGSELSKPEAQRKLSWLVNMAISRRGGECLSLNNATAGAGKNHRGKPRRKECGDYVRGLLHDRNALNTPRLRIYQLNTPELQQRFANRIVSREDY